jgi:hypothetical protein
LVLSRDWSVDVSERVVAAWARTKIKKQEQRENIRNTFSDNRYHVSMQIKPMSLGRRTSVVEAPETQVRALKAS